MGRTLAEIAESLNLGESSVQNPIPRILLCGGPLAKEGEASKSLRSVLVSQIKGEQRVYPSIVLAEDAAKWYRNIGPEHFTDLVEFEMQIADLSTMILLIVESPGSMAELGAFSYVDRILKKLFVVLETEHQYDQSFIMDGPIARVKDKARPEAESGRFYTCRWMRGKPDARKIDLRTANASAQDILRQLVQPAISGPSYSQKFQKKDVGHQMLLIADLVSLCGAVRLSEILELLRGFRIEIERKRAEQYLSLLEKMSFLVKRHEGSDDYYAQTNSSLRFVNYSLAFDGHFDRARLRTDVAEALRTC